MSKSLHIARPDPIPEALVPDCVLGIHLNGKNMETPGIGSQRRITSTVSVQQVGAQVGHTTRRACGGMEPRKQRSEIMKSLRSSKFQLPYPAGAVDPEVDLQVAVRAHLKARCGHHSIADGAELTMPHS